MQLNIKNYISLLFNHKVDRTKFAKQRSKRYSYQQLSLITKQMADLLASGVDYNIAFFTLSKQSAGGAIFRNDRWRILLEEGKDVSAVFRYYNFPELCVHTIEAGEQSGRLIESFRLLSEYYENLAELHAKVVQAIIYPCMILITISFSLYFMIHYVLPNFQRLYIGMGIPIPESTALIFKIHAFLLQYQTLMMIVAAIILAIIMVMLRSKFLRSYIAWFSFYLPGLRHIMRQVYTHHLIMQLSLLIRGGLSVQQSFEYIDRLFYGPIAIDMKEIKVKVLKGETLSTIFRDIPYFDFNLISFLEMGETTGSLHTSFTGAEIYYSQKMKQSTQLAIKLIEPTVIFLIGISVACMILALLLPVFDLLETI
ncbi:hypothetical protein BHU72_02110 [Desulfuribacillus stibiiarsenatis]|uniref:Type II secretion system protein GspF domain-containing protein n=1 Tax=Desulfuribacillus stibiiarsenatis TaxID=1390249 RepID=A0A1E5L680_9FIRM|nr:type II secretion system F family protein [Desulfuribacillus stibiiarsenatis]OEH85616.1 hypothetical protein BHU72_02110 [Desulfuribacillus stibiiarsenatis]